MSNIVHVINNLAIGGAEKMLVKLVNHQNEQTDIISLIGQNVYKNIINTEVKIQTVNLSRSNFFVNIIKMFNFNLLIKKKKPKVVVCWLYHSCFFVYFYKIIFNKKFKLIWNIRQIPPDFNYEKKTTYIVFKVCSFLSSFVDGIIFNSKDSIIKHQLHGYKNKNIIYIPNGFEEPKKYSHKDLDEEIIVKIKNKKVVSMFARFHPAKGHRFFLHSIKYILKELNDVIFILGGEKINYQNNEIMNIIDEQDINKNLILLGSVKNIDRYIQISDLVINCSISSEGFPNIIGETIMNNKICLSSNISDNKLIIDDNNLIFENIDPFNISKKILEILKKDESELRNISYNQKNRFKKKYNIENICNKYDDYLSSFRA